MSELTVSAIESFAIKLSERLGYIALHGPDIEPDGVSPERGDYAEVFLPGRLEQVVRRIKLKVIVKRTLRQFGYPPDMQLLATETVLKQAEMIANELAEGR
jgi:hypothetical protein